MGYEGRVYHVGGVEKDRNDLRNVEKELKVKWEEREKFEIDK